MMSLFRISPTLNAKFASHEIDEEPELKNIDK